MIASRFVRLLCYKSNMRKQDSKATKHKRSAVLGHKTYAAISAVEGLKLTPLGRKRVHRDAPIEQRRADVIRAYMEVKGPR